MEFAVARAYGNIQQILGNASSAQAATARLGRESTAKREQGGSESVAVSLSAAAVQAADAEGTAVATRDFSADVIREAEMRLSERRSAPTGGYLPAMIAGLPLLPENQALLDRLHQEMRELGEKGGDPVAQARCQQLADLATCLQLQGWQKPLSEADLQREVDVSDAMAQIDAGTATTAVIDKAALRDPLSGWRQRWQQDGHSLPPATGATPPWLEMAESAGITAADFLTGARQLAASLRGEALTGAVENWLARGYAAASGAQSASLQQ